MKSTARQIGERQSRQPAPVTSRSREDRSAASFADNRPEAAAQRRLLDSVHNSPYIAAQRKRFDGMLGETLQPRGLKDEKLLQGKFEQKQARQHPVGRDNTTGLPDRLKSGIESLSGVSLDNVSVHYNSPEPAQLNALAYARGSDIHIGPGQERHLPHEAWHVVQQQQRRVKPTLQMSGVMINDDPGLEKEADQMGSKALSTGNAGNRRLPVLRKSWSATHFPAQLITIWRGMKPSAAMGATPKLTNVQAEGPGLGVRDEDVTVVGGKVQSGGMSTANEVDKVPAFSVSKSYKYGSNKIDDQNSANFRWNWSFDTANLPATLTTENDRGAHILVKPVGQDMTLVDFRTAVQGTQAQWGRINP